jgi:hypothetical protein
MTRIIVALTTLLATTAAFAQTRPLPEPGTFELLALGGVVAAVVALRNRRK